MEHLPVFLRVTGRACLVVGAGNVATPKIEALVAAAAEVTVLAPTVAPAVLDLVRDGRVRHWARHYRSGDLSGFFLAYAGTGDDTVHAAIAAEARVAGVLLNVIDRPHWCDFITPSIHRQGALTIAVSTGGASPALARRIRERLAHQFGPEWGVALEILRLLRRRLDAERMPLPERQEKLFRLVDSTWIEWLAAGELTEVERLLAQIFGEDYTLSRLGLFGPEVHHG